MGKPENAILRVANPGNISRFGGGAALGNHPGNGHDRRGTHGEMVEAMGAHHGKFPRFTPRQEMYVFHLGVGRVLDISMGGVSFSYIAEKHPSAELPREGIIFTNHGQHVEGIPLEIVSDEVCSRFFLSEYFVMERRARFGELSEVQVRQLENFILSNAHIPQCSYDTRYMEYKSAYAPRLIFGQESRGEKKGADVRLA